MNRQQRLEKIYEVLQRTIHSCVEPTDWSVIMDAVKKELTIKNWMEVRGVLQFMLNQGMIERCGGVHREEYRNTARHFICTDGMSDEDIVDALS